MFPKRSKQHAQRPAMFEQWLARFPTDPSVAELREAALDGAKVYEEVFNSVDRIAGDATLTDAGRLVRQAKLAKTKMAGVVDKFAKARDAVAERRSRLDAQMAAPFDFKDRRFCDVQLAQEIRAHFKALPDSQRFAALEAALKAGDLTTLEALGSGPEFLSGLHPQHRKLAIDHVLSLRAPDAVKVRAQVVEGETFAEQVLATILQSTADLIDMESAAAFERGASEAA